MFLKLNCLGKFQILGNVQNLLDNDLFCFSCYWYCDYLVNSDFCSCEFCRRVLSHLEIRVVVNPHIVGHVFSAFGFNPFSAVNLVFRLFHF